MDDKLNILRTRLKNFKKAAIAFSGGIDSTFLASVASEFLRDSLLLITATSRAFPFYELDEAKAIARHLRLRQKVFLTEEINLGVNTDPQPNGCLYCSTDLFRQIKLFAGIEGYDVVLDGSNFDDLRIFRERIAIKNVFGVISPLAESGLTKNDIIFHSRNLRLPTSSKEQNSCICTNIPFW
jgi:pyridinium-3,5-biscarboxylic acid mononucleotide sulfurtransferase